MKLLNGSVSGLLLILFSLHAVGQTEIVPSKTIGSSVDITNQPVHGQSEFSHSQTIYYPEQLQFVGAIDQIGFKTVFSSPSIANSEHWVVKIGTTTQEEFLPGGNFFDTSSYTEVFNGMISISGYDLIITFPEPFYYNGTDNLVLDIEEVSPGATESAFLGFKGEENFNQPPLRSKMTFTTNGVTTGVVENSFAQTRFYGELEVCSTVLTPQITSITQTTATVNFIPDPDIVAYQYHLSLAGESVPTTDVTTTDEQVVLTDLLPASDYVFQVRSECDLFDGDYKSQTFATKPVPLTVPTTLTFDEIASGNYYLSTEEAGQIEISDLAGTDGSNGILFRGKQNVTDGSSWSEYNIWTNNPEYISSAYFLLDLTNGSTNPEFTFDLRQNAESFFRLKIDGMVQDVVYTSETNDQDDFETIIIDFTQYVGEVVSVEMQHISKYSGNLLIRSAFVDNINLREAICPAPTSITASASSTDIELAWDSEVDAQWQMRYVFHGDNPADSSVSDITNPAVVEGLEPATSYDFYIRQNCSEATSSWTKVIKSTDPLLVHIPYEQYFTEDLTAYCAPLYNNSSAITANFYDLVLYQKDMGDEWIGGVSTTEYEAWNENIEFTTGLALKVDATDLTELTMNLRFKLAYYYSPQTSWFRIKVNGEQVGNSYNPSTPSSDPYQIVEIDLSDYTGSIVDVVLEHSGRSYQYSSMGGAMDAALLDYVKFYGILAGVTDITVVPGNTTAELSWTAAATESEWKIEYGPEGFSPGSGMVITDIDGVPTETIADLLPETTYDVYITAICGTGCSSEAVGPVSFTTLPNCIAVSNIEITSLQPNSAEVLWTAGESESQWIIEYGAVGFSPGTGIIVSDDDGVPGEIIADLDPQTEYDLYITSVCGEVQSAPAGPVTFSTPAACEAVAELQTGDITDTSIELIWQPGGSESLWQIEYGLQGFTPGSGIVVSDDDGTEGETISELAPDTPYDFYITAICGSGTASQTTGPVTVTTLPSCEQLANIEITDITDTSATLTWTPGGTETEWLLEYGPAGFTPGTGTAFNSLSDPSIALDNLQAETCYDMYITAICGSLVSAPADTSFCTSAPVNISVRAFEGLRVYPNPVSEYVQLSSPQLLQKVKLYDITGREVINQHPNAKKTELDLTSYPAGVYLMEVYINGSYATYKLVKE